MADYSRHSWVLGMAGLETIRRYSPEAAAALRAAMSAAGVRLYLGHCELPYGAFFDAMPETHRAFFADLVLSYESADCICTHAGLDPLVPRLADQSSKVLVWGCPGFPEDYRDDVPVVYGHRNNATLDATGWPHPCVVGNTIGIDTIAHGVLTAIRMPDRRVFQSRRYGVAPSQDK
jgi:hypothetical protein